MVRQLGFATIRAFAQIGGLERVVGTAHVALRAGDFTLGNGHRSIFHIQLAPFGPLS